MVLLLTLVYIGKAKTEYCRIIYLFTFQRRSYTFTIMRSLRWGYNNYASVTGYTDIIVKHSCRLISCKAWRMWETAVDVSGTQQWLVFVFSLASWWRRHLDFIFFRCVVIFSTIFSDCNQNWSWLGFLFTVCYRL